MDPELKNTLVAIISLAVLGVGGWLIFGNQTPDALRDPAAIGEATNNGEQAHMETISAYHQYRNNTHIIAGEYPLPTPCHILNTEATVTEGDPDSVTIAFEVTSEDPGVCAQVITPARFRVEFNADENAEITATLNGEEVILNRIEVGPEENLEDYDTFIKG